MFLVGFLYERAGSVRDFHTSARCLAGSFSSSSTAMAVRCLSESGLSFRRLAVNLPAVAHSPGRRAVALLGVYKDVVTQIKNEDDLEPLYKGGHEGTRFGNIGVGSLGKLRGLLKEL